MEFGFKLATLGVESRQFAATSAAYNLLHLHLAPQLGITPLSFTEIFGSRKPESLTYREALFA